MEGEQLCHQVLIIGKFPQGISKNTYSSTSLICSQLRPGFLPYYRTVSKLPSFSVLDSLPVKMGTNNSYDKKSL